MVAQKARGIPRRVITTGRPAVLRRLRVKHPCTEASADHQTFDEPAVSNDDDSWGRHLERRVVQQEAIHRLQRIYWEEEVDYTALLGEHRVAVAWHGGQNHGLRETTRQVYLGVGATAGVEAERCALRQLQEELVVLDEQRQADINRERIEHEEEVQLLVQRILTTEEHAARAVAEAAAYRRELATLRDEMRHLQESTIRTAATPPLVGGNELPTRSAMDQACARDQDTHPLDVMVGQPLGARVPEFTNVAPADEARPSGVRSYPHGTGGQMRDVGQSDNWGKQADMLAAAKNFLREAVPATAPYHDVPSIVIPCQPQSDDITRVERHDEVVADRSAPLQTLTLTPTTEVQLDASHMAAPRHDDVQHGSMSPYSRQRRALVAHECRSREIARHIAERSALRLRGPRADS